MPPAHPALPVFDGGLRTRPGATAGADVQVIGPAAIHATANLVDLGVVTSVAMTKLLLKVEDFLQVEINVTDHEPETFFTLAGMYESLAVAGEPA